MISVILPVYNGERYLSESIRSVLSQQGEFELLICDDASTDNSFSIAEGHKDARVTLLRHPSNRGLFPTLNELIGRSRGDIIRLWAQDDIMLPGNLVAHEQFAASHPSVGMTYSAVDVINDRGDIIRPFSGDATPDVVSPYLASMIMLYHGSIAGNIANVGLPRRVLNEVGPFDETFRLAGDFEMWVRICGRFPIGFIRAPLVRLRSHEGQLSRSPSAIGTFLEEDLRVVRVLLSRVPPQLAGHVNRYHRATRLRAYFHGAMKCLLTGDATMCGRLLSTLSREASLSSLFALWLLTLNGRIRLWEPKYDA